MTTIPPFDWHEIATKSDLARLEAATNTRLDHLEQRFDLKLEAVEHKLGAQIGTVNLTVKDSIISQTKWTLGSMFTLSGLALTIAKLWL